MTSDADPRALDALKALRATLQAKQDWYRGFAQLKEGYGVGVLNGLGIAIAELDKTLMDAETLTDQED